MTLPNVNDQTIYQAGSALAALAQQATAREALGVAAPGEFISAAATAIDFTEIFGPADLVKFAAVYPRPIRSLTIDMNPIQAGSGDPSPDNVRPITGRTGANAFRMGKNLLNIADAEIGTSWNGDSNSARARLVIPVKPNADYVLSMNGTMSVDGVYLTLSTVIPSPTAPTSVAFPKSINSGENTYLTLGFNKSAIAQSDVEALKLQLELGSTATAYEPYYGNTYPVTWQTEAGTVYGGTLDVVSGVLKARPYIASYNGETLVGPWVSSMDAYTQGGTPTTGAQVVDMGGTETSYQLTPQQVATLLGNNNVWSDGGPVTVEL